ncbi:DUF805 domain-containing protein [Endozoicomonas sp. SCSIO W0465]|uniref:DUF805 domain-containing protein n=1 Tax=Endozoicomonas sp. SCSIO W0465 TaxID=2918516 RepID=UPI002074CC7B|nr:DUF805 domain-containing protein [Endozoicomonas sp. SCSIO W0465]USE37459.1 DUF805 domain-containing protein [Endozoicomonas sp. SCSIO W0465]
MDDSLYKLIFEGETLPGFEERKVRKNLNELLNADKAKLKQLFSGKPIIIRKNLTASDIRHYERAMMKAGAQCRIVAMTSDEELPPTPLENILEQDPNQLTKPSRSSRTLQLFPRMGRVQFIASLWIVVLLGICAWWIPEWLTPHYPSLESMHLTLGLITIACLLMLTMSVRRLHDIGYNGWTSVVLVLPGVNLLFLLWLIFSSGTPDTNRFGSTPHSAGAIAQVFGLWMPLLTIIAAGTYGWLYQKELQQLAANVPAMIDLLILPALEQYL